MGHPAPPSSGAYGAYLEARLALDRTPQDPARALAALDRALAEAPGDPHLWVTRAEALHDAGRLDEAADALARAEALHPGYGPARALAAAWAGQGDTAAR